ncbi:XRE family transcriptional regulator [Atopobacter phocae]|uniref:XRE family transcriptional regulator n=1 Tax=Atopobacter phocae TaxID=136492 RepID=UPI0004719B11|nr:XRE family transcriptional regulator [Atopobacter phocae]
MKNIERELAVYSGNIIRKYRKELNMTQQELGEKVGVSNSAIANYEKGFRAPLQDTLFKLADVFNVSINEFFPNTEKNNELDIMYIYNQLEQTRQETVYNFAEHQLEQQQLEETKGIYVVGQTAAGIPIEGEQPIPLLGAVTVNLLVNGDSMEPVFYDGDIVEYKPQPTLENGEIGVFAVNGGITLKKFRINGDVRLQSLNNKYEDLIIKESDDFNILGKVIL